MSIKMSFRIDFFYIFMDYLNRKLDNQSKKYNIWAFNKVITVVLLKSILKN